MSATEKRARERLLAMLGPIGMGLVREARYIGPCVAQMQSAWTRVGPTWHHPSDGWITVGPGAGNWGDGGRGLAELASGLTAKPTWHAAGCAIEPNPILLFLMTAETLALPVMTPVRELAEAAAALEAEIR